MTRNIQFSLFAAVFVVVATARYLNLQYVTEETRTNPAPSLAAFAGADGSNSSLNDSAYSRATSATEAVNATSAPAAVSDDILVRWETEHADATARKTQIDALLAAPRSQAVITLRRIVKAGRAEDRLTAIKALQSLAAQQGDSDHAIRNVLRDQIYDGDGEMIDAAQMALDAIDAQIGSSR